MKQFFPQEQRYKPKHDKTDTENGPLLMESLGQKGKVYFFSSLWAIASLIGFMVFSRYLLEAIWFDPTDNYPMIVYGPFVLSSIVLFFMSIQELIYVKISYVYFYSQKMVIKKMFKIYVVDYEDISNVHGKHMNEVVVQYSQGGNSRVTKKTVQYKKVWHVTIELKDGSTIVLSEKNFVLLSKKMNYLLENLKMKPMDETIDQVELRR